MATALTGAPAHADTTRTLDGTVRLLAADTQPGSEPSGDVYRQMLLVGRTAYTLHLPSSTHVRSGSRVHVTGTVSGRDVFADNVQVTAAAPSTRAAATGTTRVLVILANWTSPDSMTPASAAAQMFGDTNSWYRENSYGQLGQSGNVTPWVTIPAPAGNACYGDSGNIMVNAQNAAAAIGYNYANYDRTVVYFPYDNAAGSDCAGYAGWAYEPGTQVWLNGYMDRRVTTHEQGHNYGLSHAHTYLCGSAVLASSGCTFTEYGDDYDAMGASGYVAHFSAKQKTQLGWTTGRVADLSAGGSATLAPLENGAASIQSAVVHASPSRDYWVEYRQPTGYDASLPAGATNGVLVRVVDQSLTNDYASSVGPDLLDESPSDGTIGDATLKSGQTWTTPEGINLRVGTVSSTGAQVDVYFGTTTRIYQEDSPRIRYYKPWTSTSFYRYSGGHTRYAKASGSKATFRFTGSTVRWMSERGPNRGAAKVYIDGVFKKKVNLYSTTKQFDVKVFRSAFPTPGAHRLRIVVQGTAGHPRVDVDAFRVR